jgi:hypothetical protein
VQTLIDNLPLLIQAALLLIVALSEGLVQALPTLIAAIPTLINGLLTALLASMPMIFTAAGKIIGELVKGILFNIPVVLFAIVQLVTQLGTTIGFYARDVAPKLGRNFINGLAAGLVSGVGYLQNVVSDIINGMLHNIQNILGIHSPSTIGVGLGVNFISSIGAGGKKAAKDVQQMFAQMTGQLSLAASTGLSVAGQTVNNDNSQQVKSVVINLGGVNVNNKQDVDYLTQEIVRRMAAS